MNILATKYAMEIINKIETKEVKKKKITKTHSFKTYNFQIRHKYVQRLHLYLECTAMVILQTRARTHTECEQTQKLSTQ